MAADAKQGPAVFDPASFEAFVFGARALDANGCVTLGYALDDGAVSFTERIEIPVAGPVGEADRERVAGLVALLHWVAGVSYYKTALPPQVRFDGAVVPGPAASALLEALY